MPYHNSLGGTRVSFFYAWGVHDQKKVGNRWARANLRYSLQKWSILITPKGHKEIPFKLVCVCWCCYENGVVSATVVAMKMVLLQLLLLL